MWANIDNFAIFETSDFASNEFLKFPIKDISTKNRTFILDEIK